MIRDGDTVRVEDREGRPVPSMRSDWLAWCAYYPEGTVREAPGE